MFFLFSAGFCSSLDFRWDTWVSASKASSLEEDIETLQIPLNDWLTTSVLLSPSLFLLLIWKISITMAIYACSLLLAGLTNAFYQCSPKLFASSVLPFKFTFFFCAFSNFSGCLWRWVKPLYLRCLKISLFCPHSWIMFLFGFYDSKVDPQPVSDLRGPQKPVGPAHCRGVLLQS